MSFSYLVQKPQDLAALSNNEVHATLTWVYLRLTVPGERHRDVNKLSYTWLESMESESCV